MEAEQHAQNIARVRATRDELSSAFERIFQIVRRIKGDIYEFKDATGTMKVEIDDEDWPPMSIGEKDTVKLTGEVDRDLMGREVDVEFVERVN